MLGFKKLSILIVFFIVAILLGVPYLLKHYRLQSVQYLESRATYLSKIKSSMLDARLQIVQFSQLNSSDSMFLEQKSRILEAISAAGTSLEEYLPESNNDIKDTLFTRFMESRYKTGAKDDYEKYIYFLKTFSSNLEGISQVTYPIYAIYFPSDYESYDINFPAYFEGELNDTGIFTDVRDSVAEIDNPRFDSSELIYRLDQLQVIFEDCLAIIDKDRIGFSDLAQCEDALSINELKELAFHTEKTYFNNEDFLQDFTAMSNAIIKTDSQINEIEGQVQLLKSKIN